MREWFEWVAELPTGLITIPRSPRLICPSAGRMLEAADGGYHPMLGTEPDPRGWPLPNVWLGVSVENQAAADERIPELLATPAAVRFLSCEPLLGSVDLRTVRRTPMPIDALTGTWSVAGNRPPQQPRISWVIAGCESGPGARPCDVAWLRSLRDQCAGAGVPFFLKQAVESRSVGDETAPIEWGDGSKRKQGSASLGGHVIELPYLDGEQHAAFPVVRT
jgi:hypothetical protein